MAFEHLAPSLFPPINNGRARQKPVGSGHLARLFRARRLMDQHYHQPLACNRSLLRSRLCQPRLIQHALSLGRWHFAHPLPRPFRPAASAFTAQRPYGFEAVFKDNSGNWFALTQHKQN